VPQDQTVSVLLAARDAAATLGDTLDSLARQSRPADEVVVVDDGSRDGTGDLARAAGARVVRTSGVGLAAARNAGLAAVTGDLVAVVDGDDLFTADHLRLLLDQLAAGGADAVGVDAWYWVAGRVTPFSHFSCSRPPARLDDVALLAGNPLLSTCLVRRAALEAVDGYDADLPALEDYDLWLRLVEHGASVVPAARPTMYYRREGGMTADAGAMYRSLAEVLERRRRRTGADEDAPVERHALVGSGNWALLSGDARTAREHWRRARSLGDRRPALAALLGGAAVAPPLVRSLLARRLTVDGRPLPVEVVRWWRRTGRTQAPVRRPDLEAAA
jgi:hypothetical protein